VEAGFVVGEVFAVAEAFTVAAPFAVTEDMAGVMPVHIVGIVGPDFTERLHTMVVQHTMVHAVFIAQRGMCRHIIVFSTVQPVGFAVTEIFISV
jgi:hypothetical protein